MRRMKYITATLFLMLILTVCGNKSRQTETIIYDDELSAEQSISDTVTTLVQTDVPKEEVSHSRASSSTRSSDNYDNMRGFDPASEDDMDDNGMSRYMENNDEEGWD